MIALTGIIVVVQLGLMVHFAGWTQPASERGGAAQQELETMKEKLSDAQGIVSRETQIEADLDESIKKLESLVDYVPTGSDKYAWAYEYTSRCATQASVILDSLEEVADQAADEKKRGYEINVAVRCGYNQLVDFLWRLEKDNPLLQIREVTIASDGNPSEEHRIRLVIRWPSSVNIERGIQ